MKRAFLIISLASFILLIIQGFKPITILPSTYERSKVELLLELGYDKFDQELIYVRFSSAEIEHIINQNIVKERLIPYLIHPYFNIYRFHDYENVRDKHQLSFFASVNYTHLPIQYQFSKEDSPKTLPAPFNDTTLVLVNKQFYLEPDDRPNDLVFMQDLNLIVPGPVERNFMKKDAYEALKQLFHEANQHGLTLFVLSAYRSYERQALIYHELLLQNEENIMLSAKPGHSEHQTGLSVDITSKSINFRLIPEFADTPEGQFLQHHAHRFGFIIRYPKNKEQQTGYLYEPWHLRYVGTEVAQYIDQHNLTLEEYILNHIPIPDDS